MKNEKRCTICGASYTGQYEAHTGSQGHRQAVWTAVGRKGSPPTIVR